MTLPKQVLIRLGSVLFFKWQYWKTLFKYYLFMLFSNNNIINLYLFFLSVHKNIIHNIVGNLLVYSSQLKNSLEMFYDLRFIFSATASAAEKSMQRRRYNEWKNWILAQSTSQRIQRIRKLLPHQILSLHLGSSSRNLMLIIRQF